ncbi:LOW QUALITY PROTEIN: hypothetical protein HID58_095317 [Brassica napus]|uniref:Nicotianamine synthase n=1 Tax=Brassica napus TaxID=3708 RepID=A0ABQ7X436_BRANA|nr:LOW QUALITY PROTEIN: hypothetical protein HID58_095317 [Brassica napus]
MHPHSVDMDCQEEQLVNTICDLYEKISKLESLKPSEDVNILFSQLVFTCIPPNPNIDVAKMVTQSRVQETRQSSSRSVAKPKLEFDLLTQNINGLVPRNVAFIGSGPLPLTSIVLASSHLKETVFHNFDIDPSANALASLLVSSDPDISQRMFFHTVDIINVTESLKSFDVVFLAALVGMNKEDKVRVIEHLQKHMAPGAVLMSAHGPRAFLYPIVEPCDLQGFEVLSIYHPTDDVINSVVISKKLPVVSNGSVVGGPSCLLMPCNCSKIHAIMNKKKKMMIEELEASREEQFS